MIMAYVNPQVCSRTKKIRIWHIQETEVRVRIRVAIFVMFAITAHWPQQNALPVAIDSVSVVIACELRRQRTLKNYQLVSKNEK